MHEVPGNERCTILEDSPGDGSRRRGFVSAAVRSTGTAKCCSEASARPESVPRRRCDDRSQSAADARQQRSAAAYGFAYGHR
ncbi:hypothetical protein AB691_3653 [Stutzerimonas stutzeri]|nr:hypothetical protein AB691_3653 [Stutzerimonas stutzeri]